MAEGSPAVRRLHLGARLRRLREDLGRTGEQAGKAMERSASWISRLEGGRIGVRPKELRELLDYYRVVDVDFRRELETLAERGRERAWWSSFRDSIPETYYRYVGYEHEALRIDFFGQAVIPGMLQTEAYMRAIHGQSVPSLPESTVDDRVKVRMRRQELFLGARAVPLSVLLDEAALRHSVGGQEVLCDQLRVLVDALERPNIEILVIPEGSDVLAIMTTSVTILSLPDDVIVYSEGAISGKFADKGENEHYQAIYQRLRSAALGPDASRAFINEALKTACLRQAQRI